MKTAYGVVWREHDHEQVGRLTIGAQALEFTAYETDDAVTHELRFDEITAVELQVRADDTRPSVVVVATRDGRKLEIASGVHKWVTADLLTQMLGYNLAGSHSSRQVLASVSLKPGCGEAVRRLLEAGPPFDPAVTALSLHEVYVLDDEVLFLFETRGEGIAQVAEPDVWRALSAWRELTTGTVRLAEPTYSWTREGAQAEHEPHPGLGF